MPDKERDTHESDTREREDAGYRPPPPPPREGGDAQRGYRPPPPPPDKGTSRESSDEE